MAHYEFATAGRARKDGKTAADGVTFIVLGIDHPYAVVGDETPSLLPEGAVAVRFHSIGGWGAITTGKNLGAILGDLNDLLFERDGVEGRPRQSQGSDSRQRQSQVRIGEEGRADQLLHGGGQRPHSRELRFAPRDRRSLLRSQGLYAHQSAGWHAGGRQPGVGVGCRKASTHGSNLPLWARKQIIDKKIRVFTLPGFRHCRKATDRGDLQLRMQGNAFLGAFFAVSTLLQEFGITQEQYREVVYKQYVKKFGKLGDAVVQSNMEVMTQGFEQVKEIKIGELSAADRSTLRGQALLPILELATARRFVRHWLPFHTCACGSGPAHAVSSISAFDAEFRSNFGYDQPATPLSAMGVIAAATGDTASKYVARRETPLYIPENCTQCMECISVCPDTALPNSLAGSGTVLTTAVSRYVADPAERTKMLAHVAGD